MSATEATTIRGVACFGASSDQAATIEAALGVLTDEQRGCLKAIHFADESGYLPYLGTTMPNEDEWGGAWAEHTPGAVGTLVFRGWLGPGQFPDSLVHEMAHALQNYRTGVMDGHSDAWSACYMELWNQTRGAA